MLKGAYLPRPWFEARSPELKKTLLIVVNRYFNQDLPVAESLMRVGFARGWAKTVGPAKLVEQKNLFKEIEKYDNPAIFMSVADFPAVTYDEAKKLRNHDVFVWAGPHPRKIKEWEQRFKGAIDTEMWLNAYGKMFVAEPKFLWNSTGKEAMHWYQGWIDDGMKWEIMHPAVDPHRYFPEPDINKFPGIKMAYVGGYWPEKAQAFDLYLKPWEDILTTYGYGKWPYKNYGGMLDDQEERQLYSTAGLIPLVTSPGGWMIGEITERYLKAPACKAFCIADENPTLRDIFNEDEMMQAASAEHFHELVNKYLKGEIDTEHWKNQAYDAVMSKHLYEHRALQIKNALK